MRKGETLVGDALSLFLCNVNRIPQSKGGGNKKTSPKATDNNRYAGSFVKRNRRRIIVGREDKSALNNREDKGLYYYQYRDVLNRNRVIYDSTIIGLRKKEAEVKRDIEDNIRTHEAAHMTINDGFEQYMSIKYELKPSTRAGYIDTYNRYVRNTIGNKLLKDIKYSDVKRFYSYLLEKRNLSIPTVESVQTLLHPVFSLAVRDDIIRKNPTDRIMKELKGSWNYEKKKELC